jgi:hypothetical protein
MVELDPLGLFVSAFECDGAPPPGFCERWGQGGADPLLRAWERSELPQQLVPLLYLLKHPAYKPAWLAWNRSIKGSVHQCSDGNDGLCALCADAIRAAVAEPPTLSEALSTTRGEEAH